MGAPYMRTYITSSNQISWRLWGLEWRATAGYMNNDVDFITDPWPRDYGTSQSRIARHRAGCNAIEMCQLFLFPLGPQPVGIWYITMIVFCPPRILRGGKAWQWSQLSAATHPCLCATHFCADKKPLHVITVAQTRRDRDRLFCCSCPVRGRHVVPPSLCYSLYEVLYNDSSRYRWLRPSAGLRA